MRVLQFSIVFIPFVVLRAQNATLPQCPNVQHITIPLPLQSDTVVLPHPFVKERSEKVFLDSTGFLQREQEYDIDYQRGLLWFTSSKIKETIKDTVRVLHITYCIIPVDKTKKYSLRSLQFDKDTIRTQETMDISGKSVGTSDDIFGSGITKSGSIVRGFSIGTNRDMSITSGFRLQLAGKLSNDVDVVAALTDENTPLQPEGNTQTLREVDKVFVGIKHPSYEATLGDVSYEQTEKEAGEFARIQRKILGAYARGQFDLESRSYSRFDGAIVFGSAKGKYTTNQFNGIDGVQGPYRLRGKNGEQYILVIAGSERVYIDGILMTRGELNDYTIDYASGEIMFTSRRIITKASRIVVDFEYSDRAYTRNLFGTSIKSTAFNNNFSMNVSYRREADDQDAPVDIALTEEEKRILRTSGNDIYAASYRTVRFAGVDSLTGNGLGQYMLVDTLINGKHYSILVYAPGTPKAFYSATFFPVQRIPPDSAGYIRVGIGYFKFAGLGQGNYMPYQFLPMPQAHQLLDIQNSLQVSTDLSFESEYASSQYDENRFSAIDLERKGHALKLRLNYSPKNVSLLGQNIGSFNVGYTKRYIQASFIASDRLNEVEYERNWNILTTLKTDEDMNEFVFRYTPRQGFDGGIFFGQLLRKNVEISRRFQNTITIQDSALPRVHYTYEILSSNSELFRTQSQWLRHRGFVEYPFPIITPSIQAETEQRTLTTLQSDSLHAGSFQLWDITPKLEAHNIGPVSMGIALQVRMEDSAYAGALRRAVQSYSQMYTLNLRNWSNITVQAMLTKRVVEYTDEFKRRGNLNNDFLVARIDASYLHPRRVVEGTMYYEFSNQRSARLERVFLRVAKGMGNYSYLGDFNNNGIAEETEFQPVRFDGDYIMTTIPGEQMYPVADLKASIRLRLRFSEIALDRSLVSFLKHISTETHARVEEKSTEPNPANIYLLKMKYFLRPSTTINGMQQVVQDIYLFEGQRDLSMRIRFNEKRGLSQYVSANERTVYSQQSLRIESQLVQEISNTTDIVHTFDQLSSNVYSPRERNIVSNQLKSDFAYRPTHEIEVGFVLGLEKSRNSQKDSKMEADINEQSLRFIYSFLLRGQIRTEITREETHVQNAQVMPIPYELTSGRYPGKNYLWSTSLEYMVGTNIHFSMRYQGRLEGRTRAIHSLQAEARAIF